MEKDLSRKTRCTFTIVHFLNISRFTSDYTSFGSWGLVLGSFRHPVCCDLLRRHIFKTILHTIGLYYYGPCVDSVYNINEYEEYFLGRKGGLCLGLTT